MSNTTAPKSPFHHTYDPKSPIKPSPLTPAQRRKGGFGSNGGTIPGMRDAKPHVFNGTRQK